MYLRVWEEWSGEYLMGRRGKRAVLEDCKSEFSKDLKKNTLMCSEITNTFFPMTINFLL